VRVGGGAVVLVIETVPTSIGNGHAVASGTATVTVRVCAPALPVLAFAALVHQIQFLHVGCPNAAPERPVMKARTRASCAAARRYPYVTGAFR
jgi:hypothetical protein